MHICILKSLSQVCSQPSEIGVANTRVSVGIEVTGAGRGGAGKAKNVVCFGTSPKPGSIGCRVPQPIKIKF